MGVCQSFSSGNVRYCSTKNPLSSESVEFIVHDIKIKALKAAARTIAESFYRRFFTYGLLKK